MRRIAINFILPATCWKFTVASPPLLLLTFEYNTERDDNGIADAVDVTALCTADGEANCEVVTTPPVVNAAAFTLAFTTRLPTESE